jgi:monoamine oxidase
MDADVVVLGAGVAGLAAARNLAARSLGVVLLEARDRIGGRVFTRATSRAAVPAELGAEFIHGPAEQTRALLRDAGTAAIDLGDESWTFAGGKLERSTEAFHSAAELFESVRDLTRDVSVDEFLQRFESDAATRAGAVAARAFAEGFDAADVTRASARAIADEWRSGVDSTTARPLGGYPPLIERLRSACTLAGVGVRLSTVVRQISWNSGGVEILTENAFGKPQTFKARAAIVTLPVGVLRHSGDDTQVSFEPALPTAKRVALRGIEMGHAVRVALSFRTPFWERIHGGRYHDASFFRAATLPFGAYWTQVPLRGELVVAWAGGPKASALGRLSQAEVIERALDGFGELLGEAALARNEFESAVTHDWAADPFARGAYSYLGVGGGEARAELAAPLDDTLFFAGEATAGDGQGGTVNGALVTGERAAGEVLAALGRVPNA